MGVLLNMRQELAADQQKREIFGLAGIIPFGLWQAGVEMAGCVKNDGAWFARWRWLGAWLLVCFCTPAQAQQLDPGSIIVRGNQALNQETYLALLQLPPALPTGPDRVAAVERRLTDFLHRAGYELAVVRVEAQGEQLVVEVDEGRLSKVLFLGTGSLRAIQLKLKLAIPYRIFNRPNLERQLHSLKESYGLAQVRYELVVCQKVVHQGPQVDDLGMLEGQQILPPSGRYELHVHLGKQGFNSGMHLDADYDFPDGFALGLGYMGADLLFSNDRWFVEGVMGGRLRNRIDDGSTYPVLSRAKAEARWATPPLIGDGFRPALRLLSDLVSRQRSDLDVEIYYRESLEASLLLAYELMPGMLFALGGGVDYRVLFGVEMADPAAAPVEDGDALRPFVDGWLRLVFDPQEPRRDRRHKIEFRARYNWFAGDADSIGKASYGYKKVFGFGWHDLILGSKGRWVWGEVSFDDQFSVGGGHLRGVFGNRYWVERAVDLRLEFRFSLARDIYKLSVFHDLAVFGQIDPASGDETARVADAFGLGFHALILDLFQLDLYYGIGFTSEGSEFDHGLAAKLTKVF
jgi:hypothetical protein